jgi:hypothetical protein
MFGQFRNPYDIGFLYTRNFLWMDAYRGKNLWIFFCQCNRLFAGFDTGTGGNYPVHAGFNSTGNNSITITGKLIRVQMGMSIDNAHFRSVQFLFQSAEIFLFAPFRERGIKGDLLCILRILQQKADEAINFLSLSPSAEGRNTFDLSQNVQGEDERRGGH